MAQRIFQIKVVLRGVKPKIWRRLLIEENMTFYQLQKSVQTAFGWPFSRFSEFKVRGIAVCQRQNHIDIMKEFLNSVTTRVNVFNLNPGERIEMRQDIIDEWIFDIHVESYMSQDMKNAYPICVDYRGVTPPKEIGSAMDFVNYQSAIDDENHIAHEFYMNQYYNDYENSTVNMEKINRSLVTV